MNYNGFLINGLLLALLMAVSITTQWQSKTIYDDMTKPSLAINIEHNTSLLAAPSSTELH